MILAIRKILMKIFFRICENDKNEVLKIEDDSYIGVLCYCILKSGEEKISCDMLFMKSFIEIDGRVKTRYEKFYRAFLTAISYLEMTKA